MLGIDLGAYSIKFCLTRKKGEVFEPLWLGEMFFGVHPPSGGAIKERSVLLDNLQKFWQRYRLPRRAAVSFYHSQMIVQNISLPEIPEKEIVNALYWEVDSIISGEDNFQIGWQSLGKKEGQQEILFAASPSLIVEEYLSLFRQVGIEVEALEPQILSLTRGFLSLHPDLADSSFLLLDLGFCKGEIIYFSGGKLLFSRCFNWGLERVWHYLEKKFNFLPAEMVDLFNRSTTGGNLPYQLEKALSKVSEELVIELRRSLSFLQSEFGSGPDQQLFLSGGGARIPFLRQILTEGLPLTIERITPVVVEKEFPGEIYLGALGASLWN